MPRAVLFPGLRALFVLSAGLGLLLTVRADHRTEPSQKGVSPQLPRQARGNSRGLVKDYGKLPLSFEPNRGQAAPQVKFLSRGAGYSLYLDANESVLTLRGSASPQGQAQDATSSKTKRSFTTGPDSSTTLLVRFQGANREARLVGLNELPGKSNYFLGNDPQNWHVAIPNYARVKYDSIYPGIDLIYHGSQSRLEYDFVVAPGTNPNAIRMKFRGTKGIHIDPQGDLVLATSAGNVIERKPRGYQRIGGQERPVEVSYRLAGQNEIVFVVSGYDASRPLVIDPVLDYWSHLGGTTSAIAVDANGNAYVTGSATSLTVTPGAFQTSFGDPTPGCSTFCGDAFVAKFDPAGTTLIYSTYLGGSLLDAGNAIAIDPAGNAYVAGTTSSANFPVTAGAFQPTIVGGLCSDFSGGTCPDTFVSVLNPTGTALIYSTYLGGSGDDEATSIAVDPNRKVYVAGVTNHSDYPTTPGAFRTIFSVPSAGFVSKLDPMLSGRASLVYSTFLFDGRPSGAIIGFPKDTIGGIAVDTSGEVVVVGATSASGIATPGAFQTTRPAPVSPYVAKLAASGASLVYATYLGGTKAGPTGCALAERATAVALGPTGNAFVTGNATSTDFPTTSGAFQSVLTGIDAAFVAQLNANGSGLVYSTLLGGNEPEIPGGTIGPCASLQYSTGIAIDVNGSSYVSGRTLAPDFPLTQPTLESQCLGNTWVNFGILGSDPRFASCPDFVSVLNPAGSQLMFSTLIGGPAFVADNEFSTGVTGIAANSSGIYISGSDGNVYVAVPGIGNAAPLTASGLIAKISTSASSPVATILPQNIDFGAVATGSTSPPRTATVKNDGNATLNFSGISISPGAPNFAVINNTCSSIAPAASCTVQVTFTPSGTNQVGQLQISTNAFNGPQLVGLSGTVGTVSASLSVSSLTFTSQTLNSTSPPQAITLSNPGTAPLTISAIAVGGANAGDFKESDTCGSAVKSGSSCTINVTFTPTAIGSRSASLTITDNATSSPQSVQLGGTGSPGLGLAIASGSPSSQTVVAGSSAAYTLSIGGGGIKGTVTLSCSGAPTGATCTVPSTINVNDTTASTFMVNVSTSRRSLVLRHSPETWLFAFLVAAFILLQGACRTQFSVARLVGSTLVLLFLLSGCGGGGSSSPAPTANGTPAGTYNLTVTATMSATTQSTSLTLIVQ